MNSLKRNSLWNLIGSILPMGIGLISIPLLLKQIGIERFGVLSLIWALIGYFSIFDFGVGRALTQGVSKSLADNDEENFNSIISAGLKLMLVTGLLGGFILAILSYFIGIKLFNTSPILENEVYYSLMLSSVAIPFVTYSSGLKGILEGYQDFRIVNIMKLVLGILNFLLPLMASFIFNESLIYIVASLVLARLLLFLWHFFYIHKKIPLLQIVINNSRKSPPKGLLKFGFWMTLSNIISPLMVQADRFLISFMLGASFVAYYTIPFDFVVRLLIIPAALSTALFPKFSELLVINSKSAKSLFYRSIKVIAILMSLLVLLIIGFSHYGLSVWINKDFADKSWLILSILSVGVFFNSVAQVPYAFIQASGNVKLTSLIHISEFLIYITLGYVLLVKFGVYGIALAFSFRTLIDCALLIYFSKKEFHPNG